MKFAHMADCHIGGWRDPKLRALNSEAFFKAIDTCIEEKVDFVLIAGDLFNTALPGIAGLKDVVRKFRELKEKNIPVYLIPGSHDFSPSGKTMLDVLEEADLCTNVVKGDVKDGKLRLRFTEDKSGAKITGMLGRRGMLERSYYEDLDRKHLEEEEGFKIFLFHTSITELKPTKMEKMDSSPLSLLPKGFDYYAGGHVHIVENISMPGYKNVVYPGPLFPNNFHELEELKGGGFYIYEDGSLKRHDVSVKPVINIHLDAGNMLPEQVSGKLILEAEKTKPKDSIVLIRISGKLKSGSVSDIDFRRVYDILYSQNSYFVMRNTSALKSQEFEEIKVETGSADDIEERLIEEHVGKSVIWDKEKEMSMIKSLMKVLSSEKKEGEKVYHYEERVQKELEDLLGL